MTQAPLPTEPPSKAPTGPAEPPAPSWCTTDYPDLTVRRRVASGRHIAVVTLNLPDKRNAMSDDMTRSWAAVMTALRADSLLAAVVVTGAGSAFCSGGDLSWLSAEPDAAVADLRTRMLTFYRQWLSIKGLEVPTIAAVNGAAIGAGLAVALACDIRYIAQEATIGAPFTALGLHPGMATTWSLAEVGGLAVARDMLLTGRTVRGPEAVVLGLASLCAPAEELLDRALAAADRVAAAAPVATRLTVAALRDGGHLTFEDALKWEGLAQAVTMATADLQEGLAAAGARRTPHFQGR
ncbi:MAG TPA: enoyl-CoA hydratase/isomerase family protein [Dermatophilaceae bacterium]|nr:enoyl-CoA hydratase/isomerase family protein [Dermatophilaceae bacterium]